MKTIKGTISEAVARAAAVMSETLNLKHEEMVTAVRGDQIAMIVTSEGINVGKVVKVRGERSNYLFESYSLNGTELYENHYDSTETGWANEAITLYQLNEKAELYSGS